MLQVRYGMRFWFSQNSAVIFSQELQRFLSKFPSPASNCHILHPLNARALNVGRHGLEGGATLCLNGS